MQPTFELILQHGWGFDSSYWRGWEHALPGDAVIRTPDRGYFDHAAQDEDVYFSSDASFHILVAHSLGLHFLLEKQLREADLLVISGGFHEFHPQSEGEKRRSQRVLQRMRQRLGVAPRQVLSDFHATCYYPNKVQATAPELINVDALTADLLLLDRNTLDLEPLHAVPQILLLHGQVDTVVPVQQSAFLCEMLIQSRLVVCPGEGHALPFTRVDWCWDAIFASCSGANGAIR